MSDYRVILLPISPVARRSLVVFGGLAWAALTFNSLCAQTPSVSLDAVFKEGAGAYNKGDYETSIARFEQILKLAQPGPVLEPIYYYIATAKLRKGDHEGAIEAFGTYLRKYPNGIQLNDARAGMTKALIEAKRMPEALAAISSLRNLRSRAGSQGVDNYAVVLGLTLEIADSLVTEKKLPEALELLQTSLSRDQIIERQRERVTELERLYRLASATAENSKDANSALGANRDALAARLKDAQAALKSVEDNPTFDLPLLLRQGQCYMEMASPWEATVVYNEILARFPESPDRVYAVRGLVFAKQAAKRLVEAQALVQRFIDEFPSSPFAAEIAAIGGQISVELEDDARAAAFFGSALKNAQGTMLERVIFQLGGARFALGDWAGAREMFDRYVREYPQGEWAENAAYRSAISWFLDITDVDRYTKAEKTIRAFVKKHPSSIYLPDACYRLAVCQFAFQEYKQAIVACEEWEKRFPDEALLAEVLSLKGDVQKTLASTGAVKTEEGNQVAIETYLRAAAVASGDEVLAYALNEAGQLIEQGRDWGRLASVYEKQIHIRPESKLVMGWYYWVAKAKAKAGRMGEAWDFLADSVGVQLDNADNEDVEKILDLMAQIRSRQRPPANAPEGPSPLDQLGERLRLDDNSPPLVRARLRYYQARLLGMTRKPAESEKVLLSIGRDMPADRLSAALLAVAGESLCKNRAGDQAAVFFKTLLERFPESGYRDFAYVGLGDLALDQNDAGAALAFHTDAIQKTGAPHRRREATVGQARSHLALGHLDQAAKLFETVAGAKEWRGEATALSLYHLGEIAVKQGDLPKGIAFFQRVFVSQVRYTDWVVKAYLASGQAFETLGKKPEAAATYREMLRNERLKDRPELSVARARLQVLDPSSS